MSQHICHARRRRRLERLNVGPTKPFLSDSKSFEAKGVVLSVQVLALSCVGCPVNDNLRLGPAVEGLAAQRGASSRLQVPLLSSTISGRFTFSGEAIPACALPAPPNGEGAPIRGAFVSLHLNPAVCERRTRRFARILRRFQRRCWRSRAIHRPPRRQRRRFKPPSRRWRARSRRWSRRQGPPHGAR